MMPTQTISWHFKVFYVVAPFWGKPTLRVESEAAGYIPCSAQLASAFAVQHDIRWNTVYMEKSEIYFGVRIKLEVIHAVSVKRN